jgi:hypothetical protein
MSGAVSEENHEELADSSWQKRSAVALCVDHQDLVSSGTVNSIWPFRSRRGICSIFGIQRTVDQ